MRRIVVGSDGSETAGHAVRRAAELAKVSGAELVVVRAYHDRGARDPMEAYDPTQRDEAVAAGLPTDVAHPVGARADALASIEAAIADVADVGVDNVAGVARPGDPAEAIIAVAEEEDADLIVVGNKGMTGAARFLLGSVPNKITHHAPCNVLIVRTT